MSNPIGPLMHKILLVEDEPEIRSVFERMLRSMGCSVVMAENGQEAVKKIKTDSGIRLIITDLDCPL